MVTCMTLCAKIYPLPKRIMSFPQYLRNLIEREEKVDELFNLEADLGERTNLANKHLEIVAELKQLMENVSNWK